MSDAVEADVDHILISGEGKPGKKYHENKRNLFHDVSFRVGYFIRMLS